MMNKRLFKQTLLLGLATSSPLSFADQIDPYGHSLVQANLVSDAATGNQKVCIIGTGYDINHQDLINGSNVTGEVNNTLSYNVNLGNWTQDSHGLGTHAAGTISALDNQVGIKGVNPSGHIALHVVKVIHKANWWPYINTGMTSAIQSCQAAGANIIDMGLFSAKYNEAEEQAMQAAYDDGILLVAAAGDRGNSQYYYPASYDSVISVGAVDIQSKAWVNSQANDQIELVAPGVAVKSTTPGSAYRSWDTTSAASNYVSGVAALVWSHFPQCSNKQIRESLNQTALDLGDTGLDHSYGHGLIQAKNAIDYLTNNSCTAGSNDNTPVTFTVEGVELTAENSRIVQTDDENTLIVWQEENNGEMQLSYQLFNALGESITDKAILNAYSVEHVINDVSVANDGSFTVTLIKTTAQGDLVYNQLFDNNGAMILNQELPNNDPINFTNKANAQEMLDLAIGKHWKATPYGTDFSINALLSQRTKNLNFKISADGIEHKTYTSKVDYKTVLIYQGAAAKEAVLPAELACSSITYAFAVDNNSNPHVVAHCLYQDDNGNDQQKSYYAYRDTLGWHVKLTPSLENATNLTLAIDSHGVPHLSYFKSPGTSYYAVYNGTFWQKAIIDARAYHPTLVLDNNDAVQVIYYSYNPYILRSAVPVIATPTYAYTVSTDLPIEGSQPDAVYDTQGNLHISSVNAQRSAIQHSVFDGTSWQTEDVANAVYSSYTSIVVDNNDQPLISYQEEVLYPQQKRHTYLADKRSGSWQHSLVAALGSVDTPRLQLDKNDQPVIGMYGYPFTIEPTYATWTYTPWTLDVNELWRNLGYSASISAEYSQNWYGLVIARPSTELTAPKVEQGSYVIATGKSDGDYYLRFDSSGQFLTRAPSMYDFIGNMQPAVKSNIGAGSSSVTMGDFDNDGLTDFITAGYEGDTGNVIIEFHRKVGQTLNVFASIVDEPTQIIDRLESVNIYTTGDFAAADFNSDGHLDFIRSDSGSANLTIYLGKGDGSFQAPYSVSGSSMGHHGIDTADINNDGHADFIASSTFRTSVVDVFYGDGAGNFTLSTVQLAENDQGYSTKAGVTLSDFDNDGLVDIVLTNYFGNLSNENGLAFYKALGNGMFSSEPIHSAPEMGVSLVSSTAYRNIDNAYFNDDAFMDVIVSDAEKKTIRVYLGTGDGGFIHKDQHFATHPELNGGCSSTFCLLDPELTEMYDHLNLYRSDAPRGIATQVYSALTPPTE